MQQLTHTKTENLSTNIHGNQQNIYDINIQRQELNKGVIIANTLKGNLKSQQKTNTSWLVTTIKAILKTLIHKFQKPIFSFRRTHEVSVRNSKTIAAFKGDLGAAVAVKNYNPINYGSEFRNIVSLEKLFLYHKDKTKIINIFQQGSLYLLYPWDAHSKHPKR